MGLTSVTTAMLDLLSLSQDDFLKKLRDLTAIEMNELAQEAHLLLTDGAHHLTLREEYLLSWALESLERARRAALDPVRA